MTDRPGPPPAGDEVPVLIAGGGLVGLSLAMFLAQHDVPSLIVEPLVDGSPLPRAAHFHLRTLELFRLAGIHDEVVDQSAREFLPEGALIAMDSLAGTKLADIIPSLNQGVDEVSPCRRLFVSQPGLEPILRARARRAGAELLTGHELIDLSQDDRGDRGVPGVTATVAPVDGGDAHHIRARYLVGADGAHSRVRQVLGIPFEGRGVFSNSITIYFHADLRPWMAGKPLSVIYINNPLFGGFFRLDKDCRAGFLVVNTVNDVPDGNAADDTSDARLVELVRAGAGVPDLVVEIDGVARWRATAQAAERFGDGRVFLAGDAAHLMPPNGGFGGNTGIHDAHNLAWKLAAALSGRAGQALLDTYDAERRPASAFTAEQAYSRYVTRTAPHLATDDIQPVADDFEIELGYLYRSTAILAESDDGPLHGDPRQHRAEPGSRGPHLWLEHDGRRISTIDLIGHSFTVLAGRSGQAWISAAAEVSAEAAGVVTPRPGLTVDAYRVGGDGPVVDPDGSFAERYGIGDKGAVLARPDGVVAWRSPNAVADPTSTLRSVLDAILGPPGDHR
jgi:2-polyprenyl-6-methoxyphenol hydroxylase-like FAD-dependent oxidoreductase